MLHSLVDSALDFFDFFLMIYLQIQKKAVPLHSQSRNDCRQV